MGDRFSDGTGERGPGKYDGKFDAAPDIDHGTGRDRGSEHEKASNGERMGRWGQFIQSWALDSTLQLIILL